MNSQKLNDWLQIVGMFGVMASLVFVGVQVRQTQVIGEGESAMLSIQATIDARQLLIDNIDVWVRGCADEEMSAADEARFSQLQRAYTEAFYFAWMSARHNILDFNPDDLVFRYAASVHRYPGFARASRAWEEWAELGMSSSLEAGREFHSKVLARLVELRELEPEPGFDVKHCGM